MHATSDRAAKGRRKMRGLRHDIHGFWDACANVTGWPVPGGHLEIESLDDVGNALDHALVSIRTIDLEVLRASDPANYATLLTSDLRGAAVKALVAPRNSAVHHTDLIDPDVDSAVGPVDRRDRFIILPRWKPRSAVPSRMFEYPDRKRAGQLNTNLATAYDRGAANQPVMDTLLDAYKFFDMCDPALVEREANGQLTGFPLQPLPLVTRYRRLHPDWPSESDWDAKARREVTAVAPTGYGREISGLLRDDDVIVCGYTKMSPARTEAFTESLAQVIRDIGKGYRYWVTLSGAVVDLDVHLADGQLRVAGSLVIDVGLPDWTKNDSQPWAGWWQLCRTDADFYAKQRRAH